MLDGHGERMLMKKTKSLCPTCGRVLDADIVEEEGKVWLVRTCPVHGEYKALYWSDADMYRKFEEYERIGRGWQTHRRPLLQQGAQTTAASARTTGRRHCLQTST